MTLFKLLFVLYLSNLLKVSRLNLEQLLMTSLADELQSHLLVDAKVLLQALYQPVLRNGRSLGFLENLADYTLQLVYVVMQILTMLILVDYQKYSDQKYDTKDYKCFRHGA